MKHTPLVVLSSLCASALACGLSLESAPVENSSGGLTSSSGALGSSSSGSLSTSSSSGSSSSSSSGDNGSSSSGGSSSGDTSSSSSSGEVTSSSSGGSSSSSGGSSGETPDASPDGGSCTPWNYPSAQAILDGCNGPDLDCEVNQLIDGAFKLPICGGGNGNCPGSVRLTRDVGAGSPFDVQIKGHADAPTLVAIVFHPAGNVTNTGLCAQVGAGAAAVITYARADGWIAPEVVTTQAACDTLTGAASAIDITVNRDIELHAQRAATGIRAALNGGAFGSQVVWNEAGPVRSYVFVRTTHRTFSLASAEFDPCPP